MKLKDFFANLKKNGKLTNEKYDAFLEAVPDGDMPDELFTEFEENFLTPERAVADHRVTRHLRGQILDPLDRHLDEFIKTFNEVDPNFATEMSSYVKTTHGGTKQKDTYKIYEAMKMGLPGLLKKLQDKPGATDDTALRKEIEDHKKVISEMTKKFQDAEADYKNKEKTIQSEFNGKLENYKLDNHLEKLVGEYTFADHLKAAKPGLTKLILNDLKTKNALKFVENNGETKIDVYETGEDGIPKPKFNGNSAVTIKSLLDEATKDYIKVNNTDGGQGGGQDSKVKTIQTTNNGGPERRQAKSTALE